MATIKLIVKNITEALTFKDMVESGGLHHDIDYRWEYIPKINSWLGDEIVRPASVEFTFIDEAMATFFRLKWKQYE